MAHSDDLVALEAARMQALRDKLKKERTERDDTTWLDEYLKSEESGKQADVAGIEPALEEATPEASPESLEVQDVLIGPDAPSEEAPHIAIAPPSEMPHEAAAPAPLPAVETSVSERQCEPEWPDHTAPGYIGFPDDGVYMEAENSSDEWIFVCSPLRVQAIFADKGSRGWGKVIAVKAPDGRSHTITLTNAEITGKSAEVIRQLVDCGLELANDRKSKERLIGFLKAAQPKERLLSVRRMGWADDNFSSFALGGTALGAAKVISLVPPTGIASGFAALGDLDGWRENVGLKCRGNPMMILAVSLAFSGPLLSPFGIGGGGLHFRGASSSGKTTLLRLAASVWGSGQLMTQWRATENGLEAIAATLNDTLLPIDEMDEGDASALHTSIYMLANGTGKVRMTKDVTLASQDRWRLALISSGEISLEQKLAEGRREARAGQQVRLLDIEADTRTYGVFDALHGEASSEAFATAIQAAVRAWHGTAGRHFVQRLIDIDLLSARSKFTADLSRTMNDWLAALPGTHEGSIKRVAERFALIGLAGALATEFGLTGWAESEALNAAEEMFFDWYDRRYGERNDRADGPVKSLQAFLAANSSNLRPVGTSGEDEPVGWSDKTRVYLPALTWSQIFPGASGSDAAKALIDTLILVPGDGGRMMRKAPRSIPERPRLYTVNTDRLATYKAS